MSGNPNHRFSIDKGRQVSSFEAGVDSIKRRISTSMGRSSRRSGQGKEAGLSALSRSAPRMPKSKDGQVEANGEKGKSSINDSRGSGSSDASENDGILSGDGSGNDYSHNYSKSNSSDNRLNRGNTESQPNLSLGPFTEAANKTIRHMSESHKALKALSDLYEKHVNDIQEVSNIQARCTELDKACKRRDEHIESLKNTIITLKDLSHEKKEEAAREIADIQKEREDLEEEKKKFKRQKEIAEKRAKMQEAEQKSKQSKELEELKKEQDKEYENHKQKLERDMKKQEEETRKSLTDLEANNKTLSEQLQEKRVQIKEQEAKLKKAQDDYDDLRRAKLSFKEENEKLERRLKMIENEFALSGQTTEFYEKEFHNISGRIENISIRYFTELNDDDFDTIREELIQKDSCFASIPISDSEESQNLRIAHAQRVISSSLCKNIWQPFYSEKTLPYPQFISLLGEIAADLAKPSRDGSTSGRAASVWTALTTRALESLSLDSPPSPTSTPQSSQPPTPRRADKAVDDIFRVLSPLVNLSQEGQLRKELMALADYAISVWHSAQIDELKITVQPTLNRANRNEWRYVRFDPPPSPSLAGKDAEEDVIPSTRPRIFTLFPRVIATQKVSIDAGQPSSPPGSWPQAQEEPSAIETCVHSGVGLPEWSPLVMKGKEEEEERKEFIREEHEKIKHAANARGSRKNGGHSRRESMTGSVSGPPSPISQLKGEGGMMKPVEE